MASKSYVQRLDDAPWKSRHVRTDSKRWKMLIDADRTPSEGFSSGVLEFPTGTAWAPHHHGPQEAYLIRESDGDLKIDGQYTKLAPIRSSTPLKIAPTAFKIPATGP